jgi:hypothetical protein
MGPRLREARESDASFQLVSESRRRSKSIDGLSQELGKSPALVGGEHFSQPGSHLVGIREESTVGIRAFADEPSKLEDCAR